MTDETPGRPAGRPRDGTIDARVLAAVRELLVEAGWEDMSVRTVAARAGVGRASIQRRWSSKAELVLHAVLGAEPDLTLFEGADHEGWIASVVDGSHELFRRPEVRAAVPGLLTALRDDDRLRAALWRGFSGPAARLYAGRADDDADLDAHAVLAMAAGAALFTSTIALEDDTPALRARITGMLTAAVRAGGAADAADAADA